MTSLSEKINNFFTVKKNKKYIYLIILLMIILLILFSGNDKDKISQESVKTESCYNFEEKLGEIIAEIKGVGRVSVFVSYESGIEEVVQTDITEKTDEGNVDKDEKTVIIGSGNSQRPFVKKELYPKVVGVIIVCDGGGDVSVRNNIISAVKAVTGCSAAKIGVFIKKSGGRDDNN